MVLRDKSYSLPYISSFASLCPQQFVGVVSGLNDFNPWYLTCFQTCMYVCPATC